MKSTSNVVIPAVLLCAAQAVALESPVASSLLPAASVGAPAPLPAALVAQPPQAHAPARLLAYEASLAAQLGFEMRPKPLLRPEGICGTISGSGEGWDDSRADC